jgi:ribosome-associated toxin RatA of RatAB toxin-antitoxin module
MIATIIFASLTIFGISGLILGTPSGEYHYTFTRTVQAPKRLAWAVIADVGNYAKYATNLHKVSVDSVPGVGMTRTCSDANGMWTETCTEWEEFNSYSFLVNTGAKNYPFPISYLNGSWQLTQIDKDITKISIHFVVRWKYRIMGLVFESKARDFFAESNETILDNWENEIMKNR